VNRKKKTKEMQNEERGEGKGRRREEKKADERGWRERERERLLRASLWPHKQRRGRGGRREERKGDIATGHKKVRSGEAGRKAAGQRIGMEGGGTGGEEKQQKAECALLPLTGLASLPFI